jgi:hypothetical protein
MSPPKISTGVTGGRYSQHRACSDEMPGFGQLPVQSSPTTSRRNRMAGRQPETSSVKVRELRTDWRQVIGSSLIGIAAGVLASGVALGAAFVPATPADGALMNVTTATGNRSFADHRRGRGPQPSNAIARNVWCYADRSCKSSARHARISWYAASRCDPSRSTLGA